MPCDTEPSKARYVVVFTEWGASSTEVCYCSTKTEARSLVHELRGECDTLCVFRVAEFIQEWGDE